jgi:hypothetical protein
MTSDSIVIGGVGYGGSPPNRLKCAFACEQISR